jgi:hypothetical protein
MIVKTVVAVAVAVALCGCASTSHKMNSVNVGMTKAEVIAVLGPPASTSAREGVEYMIYKLRDHVELDPLKAPYTKQDYFVRLCSGKVDAFGKVGDFDSTQIPESKHTFDVKVKEQ